MKLPIADYRLQIADCRMKSVMATLSSPIRQFILHSAFCILNSEFPSRGGCYAV